jgi:hypothetical protein
LVAALTACAPAVTQARSAALPDGSERTLPASAAILGDGFVDALPAPGGTMSPSPSSYDDVAPPAGYRVVLLRQGDGPETTTVVDAVTAWADEHGVALETVTVVDRAHQVDGIVAAIDRKADLVVAAGPELVDALALVTASHLDAQFLLVGAQLPEPTDNVTAAIWPGADTRGSEIAGDLPDPSAFSATQARKAVQAGVASVLAGLTGFVVEV